MPISIDEFGSRDSERGETNRERVVRFLANNPDKAYRAIEIAEATDINKNSIHPVLQRLKKQELVRHKRPYWTIGDRKNVRDAFQLRSTASFLDETLGTESRTEWVGGAATDEESVE